MTEQPPGEPFKTPLDQTATVMREQYLTFRRNGFGRWEALFMVCCVAMLPRNDGSDNDA